MYVRETTDHKKFEIIGIDISEINWIISQTSWIHKNEIFHKPSVCYRNLIHIQIYEIFSRIKAQYAQLPYMLFIINQTMMQAVTLCARCTSNEIIVSPDGVIG